MSARIELDFFIESQEGGFSASCFSHGIFTQGRNKDDLQGNIQDAVRLHFDDFDFGDSDEIKFSIRLLFVGNQESMLVTAA
jgi:hypothetical protein